MGINQIIAGWNWFIIQNLGVQVLVIVGIFNILIAGLKQLGFTAIANICQKIENALLAMTKAAKTAFIAEIKK